MTPLEKILIRHEGLRLHPYTDTRGKLTIGVGRNLTDSGIDNDEARMLLRNDIADIFVLLNKQRNEWILDLSSVRRDVCIMMIFNLGMRGFLGFKLAIKAMKAEDWKEAEHQMLYTNHERSPWHRQIGKRARTLATMMRKGRYA